jgi:hypothetical protein
MNKEQKQIVEKLIVEDKLSDQKVVDATGLDIQAVRRFRKEHLKIKKGGGQFKMLSPNTTKSAVKQEIIREAEKPIDKEIMWRTYFKTTPRYKRLQRTLTKMDLEEFIDQWVSMQTVMEDITPAEQDSLELMIIYKLRIDDNQKSIKEANDREEEIRAQVGARELNLENETDRMFFEMINSTNRFKQELNRDLKDLTDKYLALQKAMNQTREQRESKQKVGADTFLSLVRSFNDKEKRESMNKYNELMKMATQNQIKKFKQPHEFADKSQEPIILDGSDFIQKTKESPSLPTTPEVSEKPNE